VASVLEKLQGFGDNSRQMVLRSRCWVYRVERSASACVSCVTAPTISATRPTSHSAISRMSIVVVNSLVAPSIVGAGAVGWSGATRAIGQEVPT